MAERRSPCPLSVALDLLGDRWTLLVLRDLFVGKRRFAEFLEGPEKIATNILSDRLRRLECAGLVQKEAYQAHPPRHQYRLTTRGADTLPILQATAAWSRKHFPDTWQPPAGFATATPESWLANQNSENR